jgi:aldehyde dehydrogenase (NAD+)
MHRMYEQWHPLGVTGIISAFNFPVAVWSWNAFVAAVCGNTCIWKPSLKTPLTAIAVQHICNQVLEEMSYPAIFNLVIGKDTSVTAALLEDEDVPLISFTGSSEIGKMVAGIVHARFGKTLLELGGNNALIIDNTADLGLALRAVVFGSVGTAGQRCTSTRRVMVHEDVYDTFIKNLSKVYQQIKIGDPLEKTTHMGPVVDEKAVILYKDTLLKAKEQGGKLICGGKVIKGEGYFVEPAIIACNNVIPLMKEENFVPILYVLKVKSMEEAIQINNDVPQGLSSSLFTNSLKAAEQFLSHTGSDCGIANINIGTSGAEIGGAFGGEKHTGGGRESGSDAWKAYMRRQTNTINWGDSLPLAQGIEFNI